MISLKGTIKAMIRRPSRMFFRQATIFGLFPDYNSLPCLTKKKKINAFLNVSINIEIGFSPLNGSGLPQNLSTLHFHLTPNKNARSQKLLPPKNARPENFVLTWQSCAAAVPSPSSCKPATTPLLHNLNNPLAKKSTKSHNNKWLFQIGQRQFWWTFYLDFKYWLPMIYWRPSPRAINVWQLEVWRRRRR